MSCIAVPSDPGVLCVSFIAVPSDPGVLFVNCCIVSAALYVNCVVCELF